MMFPGSVAAWADFFLAQIPSWEVTLPKDCSIRLKPPTSENEIEVMTAVSNLANTVIANTASRALAKYVFTGIWRVKIANHLIEI